MMRGPARLNKHTLRPLTLRATHLLLLGIFLTAAATTTLGYIRWVGGQQFFPRTTVTRALRQMAGPVGAWLPQVLSATPPRTDLLYLPFADEFDDRDWAAAYYLYPRRLHVRPTRFRDHPLMAQQDVRAGRKTVLAQGRLLTLPGWQPPAATRETPVSPVPGGVSVRGVAAWILTIATALGVGGAGLLWISPPLGGGTGGRCLRAGLALTVGLGAVGTVGFFGALIGIAGSTGLVLGTTVAGLLALVPAGRWMWAAPGPTASSNAVDATATSASEAATPASTRRGTRSSRLRRVVEISLSVWLVAVVAAPLVRAVSEPMLHWDERFQWAYKGKILLEEGGINGASFQALDRPHLHRRYPLLVPALEAHIARLAGGFAQERAIKAIFPVFLTAMILMVYGVSRRHLTATPALLLAGTLAALPPLHHATRISGGPAHTGFADLPLATFITAAAAVIALWLAATPRRSVHDGDTRTASPAAAPLAWIAAAAAGFAFLTKPEGLVTAAAVLVIIAAHTISRANDRTRAGDGLGGQRQGRRWAPLATAVGILALLAIPRLWLGASVPTVGTVGYTGDADYLSRLFGSGLVPALQSHLGPSLRALLAAPFSLRWSGMAWLPLLGILAAPLLPRRSSHLPALLLLLPMAADLVAFTLTGSEITWHLAVALDRVWIQVLGPVFLISGAQLALLGAATRQS